MWHWLLRDAFPVALPHVAEERERDLRKLTLSVCVPRLSSSTSVKRMVLDFRIIRQGRYTLRNSKM